MLNKKFFLSMLVLSTFLFIPTVASSQQVDIKTGNMRTVVDDDGNVYIENSSSRHFHYQPITRVPLVTSLVPIRMARLTAVMIVIPIKIMMVVILYIPAVLLLFVSSTQSN
jgi:hypothetical protein